MPRSTRLSVSLAILAVASAVQAQAPSIGSVSPQAVRPGQSVDLILGGGNLKGASQLLTTFAGQAVLSPDEKDNGTNPGRVVYRVTLPADAPVGIHAIRVATPTGVSPLRLCVVDDIPSTAQAGNNTAPATAQVVSLPAAIDGSVPNLAASYYKFAVTAGQKVSFEVLARRLGSTLDPVIRLMDIGGREITYNDDAPGLMADSQLSYTFPAAGEYLLEIRDIRYQGGAYRVRIGDFPLVNVPYPMGIKRGADAQIQFAGPDIEGTQAVAVKAPADPNVSAITVGVKRNGGQSSGLATLLVTDQDEALEVEPNDEQAQATRVPLGAHLNGRFEKAGDSDRFIFTAKKDQKYTFRGITRQLGSPVELTLKLLRPAGNSIFSSDVNGLDCVMNAVIPADGDYTLVAEDLHRRGGSQFAYRVDVSPTPAAGFSLAASADSLNIPAGGTTFVTVTAVRAGYAGPIQVSAVDLPPGVTSTPTTIGPNLLTVVLTVQSAADAAQGKPFPIKIVGKAKIGDADFQAVATVDAALKTSLNAIAYPPVLLERNLALAVSPAVPVTLRAEPAELVFGQSLTATVKIIATRAAGYDEDIALAVTPAQNGLPAGVTAALKPIVKATNEIEIVFTATNATPLGDYTGVLVGTLKHGNETVTQAPPGIGLKIQPPYAITPTVADAKLPKGGSIKVKVAVQRNPAFKGPVTLTLQNLPKGVTAAPAPAMLTPEQNELELTLTAAADAAVGAAANVTIKADAQGVGNAALTVTTPAIAFTVE